MVVSVALDISNNQCNRLFDYEVTKNLEPFVKIGVRVFVPFGSRSILGFVVKIIDETTYDKPLKSIKELIDFEPVLSDELIELGLKMSEYYFSFLSLNYLMMIPSSLKVSYPKVLKVLDESKLSDELLKKINNRKEVPLSQLDEFLTEIGHLKKINAVSITNLFKENGKALTKRYVYLADMSLGKTNKQREILSYLFELNDKVLFTSLVNDMGYSASVLNTLNKNGAIIIKDEEVYRSVNYNKINNQKIVLNTYQEDAFKQISNCDKYEEFLLHGVCGSGKTEVYLNLIEKVIKDNKTALMLVPEISLSSQISSRFKARFGDMVAILHSRLSAGEKFDEWRRIKRGEAKIVIGARSALFAPLVNLGIIIMDEEQETSYIQDSNPRYDSHFVARFRARYHKIPLVFGSATPSVETYYNALNDKIKLLEIPIRANNTKQNKSLVIDMRQELRENNKSVLSRALQFELKKTLSNNEQAILLINRRGYSTFVMCRSCGKEIKCPHCDVSLTYHRYNNSLVCHYCGHQTPSPSLCPTCQSPYIRFVGDGTQKVEEELKYLYPEARVLRMDSDTTKGKNGHNEIIASFQEHEADILLGTQVVAKGLDFPLVSLVGVVNADLGLKIPYYDAYEKSFDLLEQSSGRAGRKDTTSTVIIQSYSPDNEVIQTASCHDYKSFYQSEIKRRRLMKAPPFNSVIELVVSSKDISQASNEAISIVNLLKIKLPTATILGPVKNCIFKIKDRYHYQITLKVKNGDSLDVLSYLNERYQVFKDIYLSIRRM